jgi:hypothetical protein
MICPKKLTNFKKKEIVKAGKLCIGAMKHKRRRCANLLGINTTQIQSVQSHFSLIRDVMFI